MSDTQLTLKVLDQSFVDELGSLFKCCQMEVMGLTQSSYDSDSPKLAKIFKLFSQFDVSVFVITNPHIEKFIKASKHLCSVSQDY